MQIDRSNYEIRIIDWLDGNLNNIEIEQLKLFMSQNQDLNEEFSDLSAVNPAFSTVSYPHKVQLKKTFSDLPQSQFEFLCTAWLENDLTISQKEELMEMVNADPEKKMIFDQIQATRISPEKISCKNKKHLLKRTSFQKTVRLSVTILSVAAAISIIVVLYSLLPAILYPKKDIQIHNLVSDNVLKKSSSVLADDPIKRDTLAVHMGKTEKQKLVAGINKQENISAVERKILPAAETSGIVTDKHETGIAKIPVYTQVDLMEESKAENLIPSGLALNVPGPADERSHLGKLISKTFRVKLLKAKTSPDTPIKGYEIAEAGVTELNKLFGWKMALDTRTDEDGRPSSVSFSSRFLKISAPVKKREIQP